MNWTTLKEWCLMLKTDQPRYRVKISLDHGCDNPMEYGMFDIVSFNSRHANSGDPDLWFSCQYENDFWYCGEVHENQLVTLDGDDEPHEWMPNPLMIAPLSYYEHGRFKWMVGNSTVPDYGGFDTVRVAGLIAFKDDKHKQEFLEWMPEAAKLSYDRYREYLIGVCESVVEEYTAWGNGDCYGYEVLEWDPEVEEYSIEVDSCWGFIGDYVYEAVKEVMDVEDPKEDIDYELSHWYNHGEEW